MPLFDAANHGFLNDAARDALALAGCVLGVIPLLPLKKLEIPAEAASEALPATHLRRLVLLPVILSLSLPVAVLGWIYRRDSLGETVIVLQYFLSFLYAIGATISVFELLRRYGFSVRIFAILTCSFCALIAGIAAAASGVTGIENLPGLSFAAAVALAFFPVALGTPIALLMGLVRLMWKAS